MQRSSNTNTCCFHHQSTSLCLSQTTDSHMHYRCWVQNDFGWGHTNHVFACSSMIFFYFYTKSGVSIIWSDRPTSLMNVLCMLKRVCMTIQMSIIEDMCTNGFQRTGGLYIRGALLDDGPMRLAFWYSEMVRLYHQRFVYYVLWLWHIFNCFFNVDSRALGKT